MKKKNNLIIVEDALNAILAEIRPVDTERLPLEQTLNRVLAEPIVSEINVPPFVNSAMDGYAVRAADTGAAPVRLRVIENIAAGDSVSTEVKPGSAARIMTGAPMPAGADAVVRFEETSERIPTEKLAEDEVVIYKAAGVGDNVRPMGEDIRAGQIILEAGHRLRPQDIGVMAAIGRASVPVYRKPRVAILATGDELVPVDTPNPLEPGKIRNSNESVQVALVKKYGGQPIPLGIARDTVEDLTAKIQAGLAQQVDLFLSSAGVSIGDFDIVKNVLAAEGEMQFWQVAIKPGKPLAFGLLRPDVPLLGLPGNPVASMVAFEVFARPALLKLGGQTEWDHLRVQAILEEDITNSGRRHFMRAFLHQKADGYHVTTRGSGVKVQGSGILSSMVWANCLAVVPEDITYLSAGTPVECWIL